MCKYCGKDKNGFIVWNELPPYSGTANESYSQFSISCKILMLNFLYKNIDEVFKTEIDFFQKCGNPLGEVKPLTVEQLRNMDGKPVYIKDIEEDDGKWYIVKSLSDEYADRWLRVNDSTGIALGRIEKGITCCYDREPKGEAE